VGVGALEQAVADVISEWVGETDRDHLLAAAREAIKVVQSSAVSASLRDALEKASRYIKLNGHHSGSWHNDPGAWNIITKVIEPVLAQPVRNEPQSSSEWCQPTDCGKPTPRKFMIYFDDPEHGIMVFDDEAEARATFEAKNTAWNCYLFGTLPRQCQAESAAFVGVEEPVARAHITLEDDGPYIKLEVLNGELLQPSMSPVDLYAKASALTRPERKT